MTRKINKPIGCSDFPKCNYSELKTFFEYIGNDLEIPLTWRPNFSREVEAIMKFCQSRAEKQYLLGATYFVDSTDDGRSKNTWIKSSQVKYHNFNYDGLVFECIFNSWDMSGEYSPTSLAIVPQIKFGDKLHHDFGIFCSGEKTPNIDEWDFELAVEIDYHPSHEWNPGDDKFRDSLVSYKVIRILRDDKPLEWFSKIKSEIGSKIYNWLD